VSGGIRATRIVHGPADDGLFSFFLFFSIFGLALLDNLHIILTA
jgi:hypothetical protein